MVSCSDFDALFSFYASLNQGPVGSLERFLGVAQVHRTTIFERYLL